MQPPQLVTLVEKTDASYLRFLNHIESKDAERYKSQLKDPFAAEHLEICHQLEEATLRLFALTNEVRTGLVLKGYTGQSPASASYRFLETDFIRFESTEPRLFGELKITVAAGAKRRAATRQIEQRLELATRRWPNVKGIVICFSTAKFMGREEGPRKSSFRSSFSDAITSALDSSEAISAYELDFQTLTDRLVELEFLETSTLKLFRQSFEQMKAPMASSYLPSGRGDAINSLGNAFGDLL